MLRDSQAKEKLETLRKLGWEGKKLKGNPKASKLKLASKEPTAQCGQDAGITRDSRYSERGGGRLKEAQGKTIKMENRRGNRPTKLSRAHQGIVTVGHEKRKQRISGEGKGSNEKKISGEKRKVGCCTEAT